jgi:hypothetical protein
LVNKTSAEVPWIPGKTPKGLIRDAATQIQALQPEYFPDDFFKRVFGEKPGNEDSYQQKRTSEGECFFTDARLPASLEEAISAESPQDLYALISSTEIDEHGVALSHSLRTIEASIPLQLYGRVIDFPDQEEYEQYFESCLKWIKRLGLSRSRGLGTCTISLISTPTQ